MKKINSFRKMKAICIAIGLLTVFSASAEVPAFDSDKPVTTFTTSYSQVFNTTWDGTTFFNQWDMIEPTIPFAAADVAAGYLQFKWSEKRVLRSKSTYSTPYVFSTVLDWSAGPTTNGGVIVRAKATGNIEALQEPGNDWGKMNMTGIAFYPTTDGQNLTVQFSATANGAGSTAQTRIDVPKPAGVTSLLNDQGTIRIEDFGTTLYVYYRGARYIRIDLGGLAGGVYTSGTVYNSDMTSIGTFTGMEVVAAGKVGIAQRLSDIRLYSASVLIPLVVSNVSTLSDIKIGETSIPGFSPSTMSYQFIVPYVYPPIVATPTNAAATCVTTITNGTASIVVTASDGITQSTYTVGLSIPSLPAVVGQSYTLSFENFNSGGEGVGYHDADPLNNGGAYRNSEGVDIQIGGIDAGGYNIGWTVIGEWLEYTFNVPVSGLYNFEVFGASPVNDISFYFDYPSGSSAIATIPNTGGLTTWSSANINIPLTAGKQTIRFNFASGNVNIDKAIITLNQTTSVNGQYENQKNCKIYPNPTSSLLNVTNAENATISIFDINGQTISSFVNNSKDAKINVENFKTGNYIIKIEKDTAISSSLFTVK